MMAALFVTFKYNLRQRPPRIRTHVYKAWEIDAANKSMNAQFTVSESSYQTFSVFEIERHRCPVPHI